MGTPLKRKPRSYHACMICLVKLEPGAERQLTKCENCSAYACSQECLVEHRETEHPLCVACDKRITRGIRCSCCEGCLCSSECGSQHARNGWCGAKCIACGHAVLRQMARKCKHCKDVACESIYCWEEHRKVHCPWSCSECCAWKLEKLEDSAEAVQCRICRMAYCNHGCLMSGFASRSHECKYAVCPYCSKACNPRSIKFDECIYCDHKGHCSDDCQQRHFGARHPVLWSCGVCLKVARKNTSKASENAFRTLDEDGKENLHSAPLECPCCQVYLCDEECMRLHMRHNRKNHKLIECSVCGVAFGEAKGTPCGLCPVTRCSQKCIEPHWSECHSRGEAPRGENDTCILCVTVARDTALRCGHIYCGTCITNLHAAVEGTAKLPTCPECRAPIEKEPLRVFL